MVAVIYFTDEKQRFFEFSLKFCCCFISAFRCDGAQQGVIFASGKGVFNRIKIITAAKFQQGFRNRYFVRIKRGAHLTFLGNMREIRAETIAGVNAGVGAGLGCQKTPFVQVGFR